MLAEDTGQDLFSHAVAARWTSDRLPGTHGGTKNKAQGTFEPTPVAHFPEHNRRRLSGILGLAVLAWRSVKLAVPLLCRPTWASRPSAER